MRRWLLAVIATLGLAGFLGTVAASPAQAEDYYPQGQNRGDRWGKFWHRVNVDWHRNNAWPEPFLSADRAAVRGPFSLQADNGWKMQNTVGTFLFSDNQELNKAGELLVKWIVTQAPHHRRAVFVLKGETAEQTQARIASVNAAVAKYAGGAIPPVIPTDTEPLGWSGSYVDAMAQQLQATIPSPRLSGGGESGGGGSSGGGSSGSSGSSQ